MGEAIGEILPSAVAVAISPVPIIAVILMLFSRRAGTNSLVFLIGWLLGLAAVGAIVLAFGDVSSSDGGASTASGVVKLASRSATSRATRLIPTKRVRPGMAASYRVCG